jgi:hypothetical protein
MSMNWLKRHDLAVFFILAFGLSWWVWPLVLLNPEGTPLVPFGPLIAALIVLALTRGGLALGTSSRAWCAGGSGWDGTQSRCSSLSS